MFKKTDKKMENKKEARVRNLASKLNCICFTTVANTRYENLI